MTDALLSLNPNPPQNQSPSPPHNPSPNPRQNPPPHESGPSTEQSDTLRARYAENVADALGGLGGDPEPEAKPKPAPGVDGRIEFRVWKTLFCMPFQAARGRIAYKTRIDLQTLNLTPDDPIVDAPAQALFDLACAVPWFDRLTKLDNPYLGPSIVLGMFAYNIAGAAAAEFEAAKKAPTIDQPAQPAA